LGDAATHRAKQRRRRQFALPDHHAGPIRHEPDAAGLSCADQRGRDLLAVARGDDARYRKLRIPGSDVGESGGLSVHHDIIGLRIDEFEDVFLAIGGIQQKVAIALTIETGGARPQCIDLVRDRFGTRRIDPGRLPLQRNEVLDAHAHSIVVGGRRARSQLRQGERNRLVPASLCLENQFDDFSCRSPPPAPLSGVVACLLEFQRAIGHADAETRAPGQWDIR
jgi:hypothetical protein